MEQKSFFKPAGVSNSVQSDPFYRGYKTLSFDPDSGGVFEMTDAQKEELFMSVYLSDVQPFSRYPFLRKCENRDLCMKQIKNGYGLFVLGAGWTESKYVSVIDLMLVRGIFVDTEKIAQFGTVWEKSHHSNSRRRARGRNRKLS